MFVHFESWTLSQIDCQRKGFSYPRKILKVFTDPVDPKVLYGKKDIVALWFPHDRIVDDNFRDLASELENYLMSEKTSLEAIKRLRTLFNFGFDAGFTALNGEVGQLIHGLDEVSRDCRTIHIDLLSDEAISRVKSKYRIQEEGALRPREGVGQVERIRRKYSLAPRGKER